MIALFFIALLLCWAVPVLWPVWVLGYITIAAVAAGRPR